MSYLRKAYEGIKVFLMLSFLLFVFLLLLFLVLIDSAKYCEAQYPSQQRVINRYRQYDYAPNVFYDKQRGIYRMYWCGNANGKGDHILYSESRYRHKNWSRPRVVVSPSFSDAPNAFDRDHVCDPSVIKVNGVYFMYYSGLDNRKVASDIEMQIEAVTQVGVAWSLDGYNWYVPRLAILKPYRINLPGMVVDEAAVMYGAGQPSAVYKDGYFYITYYDSTGSDEVSGNWFKGYLLKSKDPLFGANAAPIDKTVYAWTNTGWVATTPEHYTDYGFAAGNGHELAVDFDNNLILFFNVYTNNKGVGICKFNQFDTLAWCNIVHYVNWREGVGITKTDAGALLEYNYMSTYQACGIDDFPFNWDICYQRIRFR